MSREPITANGTLQPPTLVMTATKGTPITPDKEANAIRSPNALALFAGVKMSATAAMLLGGIMPPVNPVTTLNAIKTPKLEAKLDAKTLIPSKPSPATVTGFRPKESEIDPTEITEMAQAANVTAANCPAAATDMSNSLDRSTKSGASMSPTLWVRNIAEPVSARNRVWLVVTGVTSGVN